MNMTYNNTKTRLLHYLPTYTTACESHPGCYGYHVELHADED